MNEFKSISDILKSELNDKEKIRLMLMNFLSSGELIDFANFCIFQLSLLPPLTSVIDKYFYSMANEYSIKSTLAWRELTRIDLVLATSIASSSISLYGDNIRKEQINYLSIIAEEK